VDPGNKPQFNLFSQNCRISRGPAFDTALLSSVKTVRQQSWTRDTLAPDGHWTALNPHFDHNAAFAAYTRNTLDRYAKLRSRVRMSRAAATSCEC